MTDSIPWGQYATRDILDNGTLVGGRPWPLVSSC